MKTITVMQPWAGLLALGLKENETRSWSTEHRGELLIHSSGKISPQGKDFLKWLSENQPGFMPGDKNYKLCSMCGVVLAKVKLIEIVSTELKEEVDKLSDLEKKVGDYSPKRFIWKCKKPVLCRKPIPAKGQLKLWDHPGK